MHPYQKFLAGLTQVERDIIVSYIQEPTRQNWDSLPKETTEGMVYPKHARLIYNGLMLKYPELENHAGPWSYYFTTEAAKEIGIAGHPDAVKLLRNGTAGVEFVSHKPLTDADYPGIGALTCEEMNCTSVSFMKHVLGLDSREQIPAREAELRNAG